MADNPFFVPSPLPFQAPPFDRIREQDYREALDQGMRREREEVAAIAASPDAPTFDNTVVALERAGTLLRRVGGVFHEITESNSTPGLRAIDAEMAPRLAAHADAIHLDAALFARVKAVYDARDAAGLDGEARRLVERRYRDFVRAGAGVSDADQQRLRDLNEELARLMTEFRDRLLAATEAAAIVLDHPAQLRGCSDEEIAAAAQTAAERGQAGRYLIALQNTTQQPVLARLEDRALRERVFRASVDRGRGGPHDTTAIATRIAEIRAQRARLLGFPTFAAFEIADQVARTPERALALLSSLVPAAVSRAREEAARLQARADASGGAFTLAPWDWPFFAEQIRREEFDVDAEEVRQYFELDRVLRDGVFFAAGQLFGLTFRERHDLPVYYADVRVFDVIDHDGSPLALFYFDPFSRPNKSGGAWMHSFVGQSALLGTGSVVVNVLNLTRPAPGNPVLLAFDDVETLFHEFGHTLHEICSRVTYPTLAGTNVPRDWVEFPSQFNEHFALEPTVFDRYARHHRTGARMPEALAGRLRRLRTFNQGYGTTEFVAAALLDHAWHTIPDDAPPRDAATFEREALARFGVNLPLVPPRYSTPYFLHIWGRGYAGAYYSYMWAEVLDQDAYRWLQQHGGLTRANGDRLRDVVLSRGNTEDGDVMFRQLCGRDPDIHPLLEARGLAPSDPPR